MEIYVYRHALADFDKDHEDPPLNEAGRKQVTEITGLAQGFGFKPTQIVSSPLVRAKETAELARKAVGLDPSVIVDECLYGGKKPASVYSFLKKFKNSDRIALVSHQPLIDHLISDLTGAEKGKIQMLNGAIAGIEIKSKVGKAKGMLLWLARPPQMN
jgi:phosphohistidine phosphatase